MKEYIGQVLGEHDRSLNRMSFDSKEEAVAWCKGYIDAMYDATGGDIDHLYWCVSKKSEGIVVTSW